MSSRRAKATNGAAVAQTTSNGASRGHVRCFDVGDATRIPTRPSVSRSQATPPRRGVIHTTEVVYASAPTTNGCCSVHESAMKSTSVAATALSHRGHARPVAAREDRIWHRPSMSIRTTSTCDATVARRSDRRLFCCRALAMLSSSIARPSLNDARRDENRRRGVRARAQLCENWRAAAGRIASPWPPAAPAAARSARRLEALNMFGAVADARARRRAPAPSLAA